MVQIEFICKDITRDRQREREREIYQADPAVAEVWVAEYDIYINMYVSIDDVSMYKYVCIYTQIVMYLCVNNFV